jgi:hypothetical protein
MDSRWSQAPNHNQCIRQLCRALHQYQCTTQEPHRLGKQVWGTMGYKHLALPLTSIYHPCTKTGLEKTYTCFLDTLDTLLSHYPTDNMIIMGANVNANIRTLHEMQSSKFCSCMDSPNANPKAKNYSPSTLDTASEIGMHC